MLVPLLSNVRFYVLCSSILISIVIAGWTRQQIVSDQLFYIRLEQLFGFLALFYWYIALLISPLLGVIGRRRYTPHINFSRRGIGVSAAYFALLHGLIALYGQLGGIGDILLLPDRFLFAIAYGVIALAILLTMTATSFDIVIHRIGFHRWKILHRLSYPAGLLILLHIWFIGTHSKMPLIYGVNFAALALLAALESIRLSKFIAKHSGDSLSYIKQLPFLIFGLMIITLVWLTLTTQSYHGKHRDSHEAGERL